MRIAVKLAVASWEASANAVLRLIVSPPWGSGDRLAGRITESHRRVRRIPDGARESVGAGYRRPASAFTHLSTPRRRTAQGLRAGLRVHRQCRRARRAREKHAGAPGRARKTSQGGLKWHWESQAGCSRAGGRLLAALATAAVIVAAGVADSPAATSCDKVAAPSGSDSAAGSAAAPYRTAGKLAGSLQPGQTGLPAGRHVRAERRDRARRQCRIADHAVQLPGRARHAARSPAGEGLGELRDDRGPRPRRASAERHASQSERLRERCRVPWQRRDELPHGHLFPDRVERLRPGGAGDHRAEPHPRLRRAARREPPSRDLHRARGQHARGRQLDLRQLRSRRADVPRFAGGVHREQRDRRQRTGRELRA